MSRTIANISKVDLNTIDKIAIDYSHSIRKKDGSFDKATLKYSFFVENQWRKLEDNSSLTEDDTIRKYFHDNFEEYTHSDDTMLIIYARITHKPS